VLVGGTKVAVGNEVAVGGSVGITVRVAGGVALSTTVEVAEGNASVGNSAIPSEGTVTVAQVQPASNTSPNNMNKTFVRVCIGSLLFGYFNEL
jgi:hypothetical protein